MKHPHSTAGTQLLKLENASPPQAALIQRQVGPTNLHRGSLWRSTSRGMMSYWKTGKKNMKNIEKPWIWKQKLVFPINDP